MTNILRAKTKFLFDRFPLTKEQKQNSELNLKEVDARRTILKSAPRRPQFAEILRQLDAFSVRKYFCTNGMKLGELKNEIFNRHVDISAVSLDDARADTNNRIRRGDNFNKIIRYRPRDNRIPC